MVSEISISAEEASELANIYGVSVSPDQIRKLRDDGVLAAEPDESGRAQISKPRCEAYFMRLVVDSRLDQELPTLLGDMKSELQAEKRRQINDIASYVAKEGRKTVGLGALIAIILFVATALVTLLVSGLGDMRSIASNIEDTQAALESADERSHDQILDLEATSTAVYGHLLASTKTIEDLVTVDAGRGGDISDLSATVTALMAIVPTPTPTPSPTPTPTPRPAPENLIEMLARYAFVAAALHTQELSLDPEILTRAQEDPLALRVEMKSALHPLFKDGGDDILRVFVNLLGDFRDVQFAEGEPAVSIRFEVMPRPEDAPESEVLLWAVVPLKFTGTLVCPEAQPATDSFNLTYEGSLRAELQTFYRNLEPFNELDIYQWKVEADPAADLCVASARSGIMPFAF